MNSHAVIEAFSSMSSGIVALQLQGIALDSRTVHNRGDDSVAA